MPQLILSIATETRNRSISSHLSFPASVTIFTVNAVRLRQASADAVKLVTLPFMRSLATIFQYIKKYPALVGSYFLFNILSAVFALVSLVMLAPFLQVIFNVTQSLDNRIISRSAFGPIKWFYDWLTQLVNSDDGKVKALAAICIVVVSAVLLKNLFSYLALYVLNPIRNNIINDMRSDMFAKILKLPIGYFNEQRKGDLMSRLTNDLGSIEYSTISFLEVIFREPITLILLIATMIRLSPEL